MSPEPRSQNFGTQTGEQIGSETVLETGTLPIKRRDGTCRTLDILMDLLPTSKSTKT